MTKSNYSELFSEKDITIPVEWIPYIKWEIIQERLWEEYEQFIDWMRWQTCNEHWAYAWDVSNYFFRRDRWQLNWLPHGY